MKLAASCLAALLITCTSTVSPGAPEPDPLSVVQALMDAQSAIDPDAALALFADDAVIVNATGDKFAGDDLRRFIQADTWANDRFAMESPRAHGDTVVWTKSVTAGFYQHLGIAPVQFAFEATVRAGRITSINAHFPPREIARIEEACLARAEEPLIYGRPCSEFVRGIKAHARNTAGQRARAFGASRSARASKRTLSNDRGAGARGSAALPLLYMAAARPLCEAPHTAGDKEPVHRCLPFRLQGNSGRGVT